MDIRRWLDDTVDAEAPLSPQSKPGFPSLLRPERSKHHFEDARGRKRSKSDSSLLAPQSQLPNVPTSGRSSPAYRSVGDSACSEVSHPTHSGSAQSESSSQLYARKPRRKTRPDRYEPSSKQYEGRGKHVHRSRKGDGKKSRRASRRKKKGDKLGTGIEQSFHAKNVTSDRLTVGASMQ
jgi:hypothetical protein